MIITKQNFVFEILPKGLIRIDNRENGLVGLYNRDLSFHSGNLHLSQESVYALTR
jgi:hypothetical protein